MWESMTRYERYQVLEGVGSQVLSVLVALPDVDVAPGTPPTFTDRQVRGTVEAVVGRRPRTAAAARWRWPPGSRS